MLRTISYFISVCCRNFWFFRFLATVTVGVRVEGEPGTLLSTTSVRRKNINYFRRSRGSSSPTPVLTHPALGPELDDTRHGSGKRLRQRGHWTPVPLVVAGGVDPPFVVWRVASPTTLRLIVSVRNFYFLLSTNRFCKV